MSILKNLLCIFYKMIHDIYIKFNEGSKQWQCTDLVDDNSVSYINHHGFVVHKQEVIFCYLQQNKFITGLDNSLHTIAALHSFGLMFCSFNFKMLNIWKVTLYCRPPKWITAKRRPKFLWFTSLLNFSTRSEKKKEKEKP